MSSDQLTFPSSAMNGAIPFGATRRVASVEDLASKGIAYLSLRYGLGILLNIGNMLVMTWWIGPHAYGIFVTAVGLTTFLSSLSRFGIDTYLVRCESEPEDRHYHVAFTAVLLLSAALTFLGLAVTPWLTRWYRSAEFTGPYLILLLTIPLIGTAGPPLATLERAMNFRAVSALELLGQVTAFVVTLLLAACGLRVWAPVIGFLVWQLAVLSAVLRRTHFHPRLRCDWGMMRAMLGFGFGFSASLRTWQLRALVNPLLIGRFAGPEGVAFLGLAIRIAEALSFVRTAAGRLAIAGLARLQEDRNRFQSALQKALEVQVASLGPLLCTFAVCGPWLVSHFLGTRWLPALEVYPFIAIGVLVHSVFNLQASALFVAGQQWAVVRCYGIHVTLLAAGSTVLAPRLGIQGYGWAELLACSAYGLMLSNLSRVVTVSYRKVLLLGLLFSSLLLLETRLRVLVLFALPIALLSIAIGWRKSPAILTPRWYSSARSLDVELQHLLSFVTKTKQRGWGYVVSLARFKTNSLTYRFAQLARRRTSTAECDVASPLRRFHFQRETIPEIVSSVPDELKSRAIERAERVLQHRFCFRGDELHFGTDVDWQACPGGNVSWRWDLNRHLFFPLLGTAYYYSGKREFLTELLDLWRDWILANPPLSANWKEPFEVAARLQNWIWAYFLVAHSGQVAGGELRQLAAGIRQHAEYLAANLEYHWPNNHLLLESKALYECALLFQEFDSSRKCLRRAQRVLDQQIRSQLLDDGAHSELSSMYHRIVAQELGELAAVCRRCGQPLESHIESRIARMAEFSRAMTRSDGSVPLLGDSAAHDTYIRFNPGQNPQSELNYWLRSEADPDSRPFTAQPLQLFPEAGYAFLRSHDGRVHLTFDFGQFSRCVCKNHAHADALSFELYCGDRPVIVDPGMYLPWNDSRRWARHFRSTAAHNTLAIDGKEQSRLSDLCDVTRAAQVALLDHKSNCDETAVTGECIPYWSAGDIRHRRQIVLREEKITIRDEICGTGLHYLDWTFQFAPEIEASMREGRVLVARTAHTEEILSIRTSGAPLPDIQLFRGCESPLRGWVSRDSATVLPAPAAVLALQTVLPFTIEFVITTRRYTE